MIIVRYLIRETVKSQLAIFFVLFLVFFSRQFINVLADASDGDIPARLIMTLAGLTMPTMGLLMFPLSIYIGILVTFGRLYAESEITVMNATGMGNKFLIRAALYLALITSALAAGNAFWLAPWTQEKESQIIEQLSSENSVELLQKGSFQRTPDGSAVVFIDEIKGKNLENVFVAQLTPRGSLLPSVMYAKTGDVKELSDGRQVLTLYDGTRYEGVPTRLDYMATEYQEYEGVIGEREAQKRGRSWTAIPTDELIGHPHPKAQAELQWRISLVICIPILTMLVVPLSAVNPRQGKFAKMGPAILVYFTYFLAISAMKSSLEDGSVPGYVGMWPINFVLLLAAIGVNYYDSVPVRKIREKIRQKRYMRKKAA